MYITLLLHYTPCNTGDQGLTLAWEDPLEKGNDSQYTFPRDGEAWQAVVPGVGKVAMTEQLSVSLFSN